MLNTPLLRPYLLRGGGRSGPAMITCTQVDEHPATAPTNLTSKQGLWNVYLYTSAMEVWKMMFLSSCVIFKVPCWSFQFVYLVVVSMIWIYLKLFWGNDPIWRAGFYCLKPQSRCYTIKSMQWCLGAGLYRLVMMFDWDTSSRTVEFFFNLIMLYSPWFNLIHSEIYLNS